MTTFNLTITLGNAEMSHSGEVADALRKVAARVEKHDDSLVGWNGLSGGINDVNGNTVGRWEVSS
jgi:hypothetical protein